MNLGRRLRALPAALLALLLPPAPAAAFWEYGHETLATIAEMNVSPAAKREIRRLLAASALLDTPTCPALTIEQASIWPDCIKQLPDRFSYAAPWHYQNVDICRPFDQESACRDGNCVSAQIERNGRLLADRTLPVRERVMALAFLVHFMGDLHQPLHAGDRGDLGGNRFPASYGLIGGRTNLHTIWDGYLAERAISTPLGGAAGLLAEMTAAERDAARQGDVTAWARESWQVAHDFAYASVLPDPCAPVPAQRPTLGEEQVRALLPTMRRQVTRGGLRLARLLDEALGAPRS
ncbi:MAG TPA: S1/P1 nuclease [Allosphingosinicella sp.]